VKKTLLIFTGISVVALVVALVILGDTLAFRSFAIGFGIFAANLLLWTVVVKELLDSAAYASLAQQKAGVEDMPDARRPEEPPLASAAGEGSDAETKPPPSNRGLVVMVVGMALKVVLLGGGIYVCLAVFRLLAIYFVGGLAAGLAFLAVAGYWSRK